MPDSDVEHRLRFLSTLAVVGGALLILFVVLCIAVLVYLSVSVASSSSEVKRIAEDNQATLCTFRADIAHRRNETIRYLENNPQGVVSPKTGAIIISAAQLQRGIDAQTATLDALDKHLDC